MEELRERRNQYRECGRDTRHGDTSVVDENFLLRTFGRVGHIASLKIMWTEEEWKQQRDCGFVAFMNRADAQAAKDEMQDEVVLLRT